MLIREKYFVPFLTKIMRMDKFKICPSCTVYGGVQKKLKKVKNRKKYVKRFTQQEIQPQCDT